MRVVHLDVETYSEIDISVGAYEYFRHSSTKLLCACYQIGEEVDGIFVPDTIGSWKIGDKKPGQLITELKYALPVWAHNAEFEREAINNLTDWGKISVEQLRCTLALGACQSLPLSLDRLFGED